MEGTSVIIPVHNKIGVTVACLDHLRVMNPSGRYEVIVMDNASTDETPTVLTGRSDIIYRRSEANAGLPRAYNEAGDVARYDLLCFMHNDVFVHAVDWLQRIARFVAGQPEAGIIGLYGARTIRSDGSFRGRTIIHAKRGGPGMRRDAEQVAVVDGLLLAVSRGAFQRINGFSEAFTQHYYDKDISLRALRAGLCNFVLNLPFDHESATSRRDRSDDNAIREAARRRFLDLWAEELPADASSLSDRMRDILPRRRRGS